MGRGQGAWSCVCAVGRGRKGDAVVSEGCGVVWYVEYVARDNVW